MQDSSTTDAPLWHWQLHLIYAPPADEDLSLPHTLLPTPHTQCVLHALHASLCRNMQGEKPPDKAVRNHISTDHPPSPSRKNKKLNLFYQVTWHPSTIPHFILIAPHTLPNFCSLFLCLNIRTTEWYPMTNCAFPSGNITSIKRTAKGTTLAPPPPLNSKKTKTVGTTIWTHSLT